jgi:hypothetical protein
VVLQEVVEQRRLLGLLLELVVLLVEQFVEVSLLRQLQLHLPTLELPVLVEQRAVLLAVLLLHQLVEQRAVLLLHQLVEQRAVLLVVLLVVLLEELLLLGLLVRQEEPVVFVAQLKVFEQHDKFLPRQQEHREQLLVLVAILLLEQEVEQLLGFLQQLLGFVEQKLKKHQ